MALFGDIQKSKVRNLVYPEFPKVIPAWLIPEFPFRMLSQDLSCWRAACGSSSTRILVNDVKYVGEGGQSMVSARKSRGR